MQPLIFFPAPVALSAFTDIRRAPTRPANLRDAHFDAGFDDDTLFYDVFHSGPSTIMVGPPLFNLTQLAGEIAFLDGEARHTARTFNLDKAVRIHLDASAARLRVVSDLGVVDCNVSACEETLFAGRRVLFTLSRNNRLTWIQDWIRYHRDNHGADAVLLYDNGSTDYAIEALAEAVAAVGGLKAAGIVSWPFKFGPMGGNDRPWDSDFCSSGMLEHARWRFLRRARSALNCDIDELVVGPGGIFAAAESSPLGAVTCAGRWLFQVQGGGFDTPPPDRARHRDFFVTERPEMRFGLFPRYPSPCRRKWAVVPRRCPEHAQWRTHRFSGWFARNVPSPLYSFRHLHAINTNWWYKRDRLLTFDPERHGVDRKFKACLDSVAWDA